MSQPYTKCQREIIMFLVITWVMDLRDGWYAQFSSPRISVEM